MQMKNDGFYHADSGQDDATRTALNAIATILHWNSRKPEIETELNEQSLADVTELTRCYEDIRYGDAEVDRALLQKMRRLSSR